MSISAISRLWWRRYLSRNAISWRELEEYPALPPNIRRKRMAEALLGQIQYFGTRADALPEWRDAASIKDAEDLWRIWPELPVLSKKDIVEKFPAHEIGRRFQIQGRVDSTGGSTGEPTRFFHDTRTAKSAVSLNIYTRIRMGWKPGMATVILWGSERDIGRNVDIATRIQGSLLRDYMVDGYRLTDEKVERVIATVRRHHPVAMYGFTSILQDVAERALALQCAPGAGLVKVAWNGGEMLYPEQSEVFRKAFGVPILNRYGGRELSTIASQFRADGPLEVLRPWQFVEVVDDRGRPVGPGETGRLLWTSTICRGTPFLRYDSGDLGVFNRAGIGEDGIAALAELQGRAASTLQLPGGRKISNLYWNHLFKEFNEVKQFQVVLERHGGLRILLKGSGFTASREMELRCAVEGFLGGQPLRLEWVDEISLTAQGKRLQVIREV